MHANNSYVDIENTDNLYLQEVVRFGRFSGLIRQLDQHGRRWQVVGVFHLFRGENDGRRGDN